MPSFYTTYSYAIVVVFFTIQFTIHRHKKPSSLIVTSLLFGWLLLQPLKQQHRCFLLLLKFKKKVVHWNYIYIKRPALVLLGLAKHYPYVYVCHTWVLFIISMTCYTLCNNEYWINYYFLHSYLVFTDSTIYLFLKF